MDLFSRLSSFDIILASQSPRRRDLLARCGIPFRVVVRPVSESFQDGLRPDEVVLALCRHKARAFDQEVSVPGTIVITADTIVADRNVILNKPEGAEQAVAMLEQLSGHAHDVLTGVCIRSHDREVAFFEKTRVFFRHLDKDEIAYYVNHYKPFDKAGAYGIQEWIGHTGITRIEGSYDNVVGLPVQQVFVVLKEMLI